MPPQFPLGTRVRYTNVETGKVNCGIVEEYREYGCWIRWCAPQHGLGSIRDPNASVIAYGYWLVRDKPAEVNPLPNCKAMEFL